MNAKPCPDSFCLKNPYKWHKNVTEVPMHVREMESHLYIRYNITCLMIESVSDLHITNGAEECIWLQNYTNKVRKRQIVIKTGNKGYEQYTWHKISPPNFAKSICSTLDWNLSEYANLKLIENLG